MTSWLFHPRHRLWFSRYSEGRERLVHESYGLHILQQFCFLQRSYTEGMTSPNLCKSEGIQLGSTPSETNEQMNEKEKAIHDTIYIPQPRLRVNIRLHATYVGSYAAVS